MITKGDTDVLIACFGKEPFNDRHVARKAAARRQGRCAYKCGVCGFWHVGHKEKRRRYRRVRTHNGRRQLHW
jgi:hypothetical protein